MSDLIDREKAIDLIKRHIGRPVVIGTSTFRDGVIDGYARAISEIQCLPSAEPERTEKRTERHECVLISRQAASEPKAVNYICTGYADGQPVYDEAECPCCGRIYEEGDMAWCKAKYCMNCGQPLLWEEEEEE